MRAESKLTNLSVKDDETVVRAPSRTRYLAAVEPESVTKSVCNVLNIAALSVAVVPER